METDVITAQVCVVGAGPAGLMLSHLLAAAGVDTIVLDNRQHDLIARTHRAGILEAGTVRMLSETGVGGRVLSDGHEHKGIYLRFDGVSHHVDFNKLLGQSVWLYPQNEVFVDLAAARRRDGGDVRFGVRDVTVVGVETDAPTVGFTDAEGIAHTVRCQLVVGADGSRSMCRNLVPQETRVKYTKTYPFAWFGILAEAPFSSDELVYCRSPKGFALISQRTPSVQRMYFQCDPGEDVDDWDDQRIWDHLDELVQGPDGFRLVRGPIFEKTVLPFRSFVQEPMRWERLFLAGDAAHTVPPTGAKGLNLAFADVALLAPAIVHWARTGSTEHLDTYSDRALRRVWKAQNFSYWMTQMLHTSADADPFDERRQIGELQAVTSSPASMGYLAECYTGWPFELPDLMA